MIKLVAIAGKIRGEEFTLADGENIIGRDMAADVSVQIAGVSKKHASITVTGDTAYLKDLGSSNGTFLNGKMAREATIKAGDKIALPDVIFQVVLIKENKIVVKKAVASTKEIEPESFLEPTSTPSGLGGKLLHLFKFRIMKVVHGINEEYEWRYLLAIFLAIFVLVSITLVIFPVLNTSKKILMSEIQLRGIHYADEIARLNARALEKKNLDNVDTNFLEREKGVSSYELYDLEGRIVRPMAKLNSYINDPFSIEVREWALANKSEGKTSMVRQLAEGEIGIGKAIMAYNSRTGTEDMVGIIAIRFMPSSLIVEATNNSIAFLESLIRTGIAAIFLFGFIYYLSTRPIDELKFQIDEALRGKRKNLSPTLLMQETNGLKDGINTLLSRIRELSNEESGDMEDLEDDSTYLQMLDDFFDGASGPTLVLNYEKKLHKINMEGEDLCGFRESGNEGADILDITREKGFAATLIELCDESANDYGTCKKGDYELTGHNHIVAAKALIGKDTFAKGFYITFIKDD